LKYLLREKDYVLITKEGMQEDKYDDELLTFLLQLKPENFQGFTIDKRRFMELLRKRMKSKHY